MLLALWYRFCLSFLGSPFLTALVVGFILSQIVLTMTGGTLGGFLLALAVIITTNYTMRKLVVGTVNKLAEENPGITHEGLMKKLKGDD